MGESTSDSTPFVAGIDGLRGLAVVSVLAFHLRYEWASGGFLGVSLFFTLSGYLITHLLLHEWERYGRIDLGAFWVRRLRRLMPAALVVISAVAVAAFAFDRFPSARTRGDLVAALGYVANWRFMSSSTSYADLFNSSPSPVLHFWSLAIEEQFYVLFPLLMAGLFALRRRWVVPAGILGLLVASVIAGLVTNSRDVVYYGTHTRAAEILAGSALALFLPLGGFTISSRIGRLVSSRVVNTVVFGSVTAGFLALVALVDTGNSWLYSGGLAATSVVSVLLIVGVQSPGLLRWCAQRPILVGVGGLSYGLYLFHWPIFLLVSKDTLGWNRWSVDLLRLVITAVLAWGSSVLVEMPIRRRRRLVSARSSIAALVVAVGVCAVAVAFVPRTPAPVLAGLDAPDEAVNFSDGRAELSVLVLGSEFSLVERLAASLEDEYSLDLADETDPFCPLGASPACADPTSRFDAALAEHRPDIVVAVFGALDRASVLASDANLVADEPEFFDATEAYVNAIVDAVPTTPLVLVDLGPPDAMTAFIEDAAYRSTNVDALKTPTDADIAGAVDLIRSRTGGRDHRERIMVIGDSTSYGVSVAIDRLEGDRIDVLWFGAKNCPLVEVDAVKWWEGAEFDRERCPTLDDEWRAALDSFQPSLVLIAVSVPEQADQRYLGDETWYAPGSAEYMRVHDEFIARFMGEMSSRGIDVMILDSPAVHGGALGGAPFAQPDRIAAWNGVISGWAATWPAVTVVPWAQAMAAFEPTPGSLRIDGVHLAQEDLDVLVDRAIVPLLVERFFAPAGEATTGQSTVEAEPESVE